MSKTVKLILCLTLLGCGILAAIILVRTAPEAERKRPPKQAALVDILELKAADETLVLRQTGTVMPAEEVLLRARVNGEIVSMSPEFVEGGLLLKGDGILKIDPTDYRLALTRAGSALEKARFDHKLELGRQDVARREWELLNPGDDASKLEKELALRIPHLAASEAALDAAKASLEKAELDLKRTDIRAPFNAVVLTRNVNIGSQASLQDALARLAGTDSYWIKTSIPVDRLHWIKVPGSKARVISGSGAVREGQVIKLMGNLEEKGRMARLLVEVKDPLCLTPQNADRMPLLLGEYVRVEIEGRQLDSVYSIPRSALRENRYLWIASPEETLDVREVEVLWRDPKQVIVRDHVTDGEQLIVSDITAPIQGMAVNSGGKKNDAAGRGAQTAESK
jgi:RND family efflux transporter MFP subunit